MINRFFALFDGTGNDTLSRTDELKLAAAALLIEAASMDGDFDETEHRKIAALLKGRFSLLDDETEMLINEAVAAVAKSGQLYGFTRVVKDRYDASERILMIEMLWEVAFADGQVDHFESNLIQRIGGLLYVTDRDRGLARQRVMARRAAAVN